MQEYRKRKERAKKMVETKIAFVAGTKRRIGFETVKQPGKKGTKVLSGARKSEKGIEVAETLKNEAPCVEVIHPDVNDAKTSVDPAIIMVDGSARKFIHLENIALVSI